MSRAAAALVVILATACGSVAPAASGPTATVLGKRLVAARSFREYPLYWLGMRYGNLRLDTVGVDRVDVLNASHTGIVRTHSQTVTFDYGRPCVGSSGGDEVGCAWPLEVQNWPACGRNAALYHLRLPLSDRIRGAPAKHFGDRVEIWTGKTDIVIFGAHAAQVASAIESANHLSGYIQPGEPLPAPAPGAIDGKLKCIP